MLLYLYSLSFVYGGGAVVQWFTLLSHIQCGFEPWPLEFSRTVFVRVKLQFLPTLQRNIGQELSAAV